MATKKKPVKKIVKKAVKKKAATANNNKVKKQTAKKAKPAKKNAAKKPAAAKAAKKNKKPAEVKKTAPANTATAPKPIKLPKVIPVEVDYTRAITPLLDRLVVRVLNSERVSAGGLIIIPDTALMATGYLKAEVLAVGSGTKSKRGYLKPLDVKVGDKVLFAEYAGTKVKFNSEELHIIHEADVMGILEE